MQKKKFLVLCPWEDFALHGLLHQKIQACYPDVESTSRALKVANSPSCLKCYPKTGLLHKSFLMVLEWLVVKLIFGLGTENAQPQHNIFCFDMLCIYFQGSCIETML